jgi:hypothetical protein
MKIDMETISLIALCLSALATVAIAFYAYKAHNLTEELKGRDDNFREQILKMYRGIILASLASASGTPGLDTLGTRIEEFNKAMEGKVEYNRKLGERAEFPKLRIE